MFPGTAIDMELLCDPLQFFQINRTISYTFRLPRMGNERIFGHAGDIDTEVNGFQSYPATIKVWGNTISEGTFLLMQSGGDDYYEGQYDSTPGTFISNLDLSIDQLIPEQIDLTAHSINGSVDVINASSDLFMKFPELDLFSYEYNLNSPGPSALRLHAFQVLGLIRKAIPCYALLDLASTTGDQLQRLMTFGKWNLDGDGSLLKILPDVTLRELIRMFIALSASEVSVLEGTKEVVFTGFGRMLDDPRYIDLSDQTYRAEMEVNQGDTFDCSFDSSDQVDGHITGNPSELTGNYLGSYATVSALPLLPSHGDYAFVLAENMYYKYDYMPDSKIVRWFRYAQDIYPQTSGTGERTLSVVCPGTPVAKSRYIFHGRWGKYLLVRTATGKLEVIFTEISGIHSYQVDEYALFFNEEFSDWIRIAHVDTSISVLKPRFVFDIDYDADITIYQEGVPYQKGAVVAHESGGDWYIFKAKDDIASSTSSSPHFTEFDQESLEDHLHEEYLQWRSLNPHYLLSVDETVENDYSEFFNEANPSYFIGDATRKRLFFWYGEQDNISDADTHWYASSDNIASDGTRLGDFALRWDGPDNMLTHGPMKRAIDFAAEKPRIIRIYAYLATAMISELLNTTVRKIRIKEGLLRMRWMRWTLSGAERINVEIEGYRL